MRSPDLTIGVPASAREPGLAPTLASLRESAERTGCAYEIVVAVNGPPEPAPAADGVHAFAATAGLRVVTEPAVARARAEGDACGPLVRLLRLEVLSKTAAWNAIRAAARAPLIVFADADVYVQPDALPRLLARLAAEPTLAAVGAREEAALVPEDGLAARVAALPYRFDFGNVPGRLYALRVAAFPDAMPLRVIAEDAFVTVRLGRARIAKERGAVVYLRPPTTWRDYLRQRVRHEMGKLQLARDYPDLLRAHGFGRTPWRAFLRELTLREYPLAALALAVRVLTRRRARRELAAADAGWDVLASTKRWPARGPAPTRTVPRPVEPGAAQMCDGGSL